MEGLHGLAVSVVEVVACEAGEDLEDPGGGGGLAAAVFGVERELVEAGVGHGGAQVAFDQRLDEQGEEVAAQQRFDAGGVA